MRFALGALVFELMRSQIVEVNSSVANWTSDFGHILLKDEEIFTNLHFG